LRQEAALIRQGADETKNDAGKVRDEAEALEGRVAVTANKIKELETLAAQDEELTTVVSACAPAPCSLECRYCSYKMHTFTSQRMNIKFTVNKKEMMYANHIFPNLKQSCNKVHLVRKKYFVVNFT
jgi:hypothetical protein